MEYWGQHIFIGVSTGFAIYLMAARVAQVSSFVADQLHYNILIHLHENIRWQSSPTQKYRSKKCRLETHFVQKRDGSVSMQITQRVESSSSSSSSPAFPRLESLKRQSHFGEELSKCSLCLNRNKAHRCRIAGLVSYCICSLALGPWLPWEQLR